MISIDKHWWFYHNHNNGVIEYFGFPHCTLQTLPAHSSHGRPHIKPNAIRPARWPVRTGKMMVHWGCGWFSTSLRLQRGVICLLTTFCDELLNREVWISQYLANFILIAYYVIIFVLFRTPPKDTHADHEGPDSQAGQQVPAAEPRRVFLPVVELLPAAGELQLRRGQRGFGGSFCSFLRHDLFG